MSRRAQQILAFATLPVMMLLVVPAEMVCCAAPALADCGAGGTADCCEMAEHDARAADCCAGPDAAPEPDQRTHFKLASTGPLPVLPGGSLLVVPLRAPRLPRDAAVKPTVDLQALLTVLLI